MKKYIFGATLIFVATILTGCELALPENAPHENDVRSPIQISCTQQSDCVLTEDIYHPCGTVSAIHNDVSPEEIALYNEQRKETFEGKQFDCDIPQDIAEFEAFCVETACVARKK